MTKQYKHVVLAPLHALLKDVCNVFPELHHEIDNDIHALSNIIRTRGCGLIYLDFPELLSHFDKGLSTSNPRLFESGNTRNIIAKNFRILDAMLIVISDIIKGRHHHELRDAVEIIFFIRQILCLYKKTKVDCDHKRSTSAVESFLDIEKDLRNPTFKWDDDHLYSGEYHRLRFQDRHESLPERTRANEGHFVPQRLLVLMDSVSGWVLSQFPELDPFSLLPKHGPGSVSDAKRGEDKYIFPHWPTKLDNTFPQEYFMYSREDMHLTDTQSNSQFSFQFEEREPIDWFINPSPEEPSAKLLAVPKTLKGPRLITSEPTAHQYLQQGIMRWMRVNLPPVLRQSISFNSQLPSQEATIEASKTGEMATVDLSSASDRMSTWTIERFLNVHPGLLSALHACRTRRVTNATGFGTDFTISLKKFAGQGSAVTFPLQSILYTCCCYAAVLYEAGEDATPQNIRDVARKVRVYGDDIIMPSRAVWCLDLLLKYLQLKINASKTHNSGLFRESCGRDAFSGFDITPLYVSHTELGHDPSLEKLVSWVDVSNNAHHKGLWSLASWMDSKLPRNFRRKLPILRANENEGCITLHTYSKGIEHLHSNLTYNEDLQSWGIEGLVPLSKSVCTKRGTASNLLQYFSEAPHLCIYTSESNQFEWTSGITQPKPLAVAKRWVSIT